MVIHITCFDVTGHTRDELSALRERAKVPAGEPMNEDQRLAARELLHAFASFVEARVPAPKDIRTVMADLMRRGDGFAA
jgi:hypothetical protein